MNTNPWSFFKYKFVISLPHRTDRRAKVNAQLSKFNVSYEFVNGIDGRQNPFLREYLIQSRVIHNDVLLRPGQLGCLASHRCLWEKLLLEQTSREPFWTLIMEDDVVFHPVFNNQLLAAYLDTLPVDARFFRLAFLAYGPFEKNLSECNTLWYRFNGTTFTTVCYAIHSDYLMPLLKHKFSGPVDSIALKCSYGMKRPDNSMDFYKYLNPTGNFIEYYYGVARGAEESDTA